MLTVETNQDDTYDDLVRKFQLLKIHCLNRLLKRHKVPKQSRRAIVGELMFEEGLFFDSGWVLHEGTKRFATLGFAQRAFNMDDGLGMIERIHLPLNPSGIHEFTGATVDMYFGELRESIGDVEGGIE